MEQTVEMNVTELLDGVTGIIKQYEARWQKTGAKYNIFKVAGIAHKEVIMCRVLADLLNPQGKHGQGSRYLKLFRETILSKLPGFPVLDIEHTRVATEYVIDENRRIDIALADGSVFVPIEVKIRARDQPKRLTDYFAFARTQNKNNHIPILYLTLNGREPSDASKDGLGKDDYVTLSFEKDIISWLEQCIEKTESEAAPVREGIKQLLSAINSIFGKSEDKEMEDAIFKEITKDDKSVKAALAISGAISGGISFRERVLKTFTGAILALVKASFPHAVMSKNDYGWDWHYMEIPIREGNYLLQVNYDWTSAWLSASDSCKTDSASQEWTNLSKKMKEIFKAEGELAPKEPFVWSGEDLSWPSLESYISNDERELYLAYLGKRSPQEVADRIISIAKALETVKA
jgi:hypothetical protein